MRHLPPILEAHALADLSFQRAVPCAVLRPYIEWFWSVRAPPGQYIARNEYMHANGSLGLVFNRGDELRLSTGKYQSGLNVDNFHLQSQRVEFRGQVDCFGVLLRPGAAYTVLSLPKGEINRDSLRGQLGASMDALQDRLCGAKDFGECCTLAEAFISTCLSRTRTKSSAITSIMQLVQGRHGQMPIAALAADCGLSRRQLERIFKLRLGLTPKQYSALCRVHHGRNAIKKIALLQMSAEHKSIDRAESIVSGHYAELALALGYYDQAHFIREFKSIMSITPGDYAVRCLNRRT